MLSAEESSKLPEWTGLPGGPLGLCARLLCSSIFLDVVNVFTQVPSSRDAWNKTFLPPFPSSFLVTSLPP